MDWSCSLFEGIAVVKAVGGRSLTEVFAVDGVDKKVIGSYSKMVEHNDKDATSKLVAWMRKTSKSYKKETDVYPYFHLKRW